MESNNTIRKNYEGYFDLNGGSGIPIESDCGNYPTPLPVKSDDKEAKEKNGGYYYPLFKFFNDEYSLILLDSEIQEIIYQVDKFKTENN